MDGKPTVDRRRATCRTTRVEAVMQLGAARSHVMILGCEQDGLRLWMRDDVSPETEITLHVAGHEVSARVLWRNGRNVGVGLLKPLDHNLQLMLNDAKRGQT